MSGFSSKKIITHDNTGADVSDISYHRTRVRVPLFEVDLGQAVYHGNYFHLFESAREDFLRHIGFPYREFMNRQMHLTIVESNCTYRKPVHYDDLLDIHTGVTLLRRRSIAFSQLVFRLEGADGVPGTQGAGPKHSPKPKGGSGGLCTQALLNMVCVTFSGQPVVLPEDFRKSLENFAARGNRVINS